MHVNNVKGGVDLLEFLTFDWYAELIWLYGLLLSYVETFLHLLNRALDAWISELSTAGEIWSFEGRASPLYSIVNAWPEVAFFQMSMCWELMPTPYQISDFYTKSCST